MHIFVSYGHDEHAAVAQRLKRDLESYGHQVWFDLDRLKVGGDWERYIEDGLDWASASPGKGRFVLLMTPYSVRRPDGYCLNELTRAWDRHLSIIPVMLVSVEPPLSVCRIQYLDMRDCVPVEDRQERYKSKFDQLLQAIEHNRLDSASVQARLLSYLNPLPFEAEISQRLVRFIGRDWLVTELDRWLADPSQRVFWITGEAGVGKSTLAAWLSAHRPEIAAFHACHYGNSDRASPRKVLTSLAYQLSTQLADYRQRLNDSNLDGVREANARALFERLFIEPLGGLRSASERPLVIVIDALDEATENGRNELASIIGTELDRTPPWLRWIVTSRPHEKEVTGPLQGLNSWKLEAEREENMSDIRSYLHRELLPFTASGGPSRAIVERIIKKSEGLFLYVSWVRQEVADGRLSLSEVEKFPQGLGGIYAEFFERYFPDPEKYRTIYRPILEAICAAREPLSVNYLARLFGFDPDYAETELASAFGSLFPISNGHIRPFHLSVLDWLIDSRRAGNHFVSVVAGHRRLADYGWEHISDAPDVYTLRYLASHLEGAQHVDELHRLLRLERAVAERRENSWYTIKSRAGQLDGYLEDVDRAWRQAQSAHHISLQVRYALCSTSIRSLADIPSPLLELALRYDVLTWQQALSLARIPKSHAQRARALSRLLQLLPEGEREHIAAEVFDTDSINEHTDVLPALMPHLPKASLNRVLEIIKNVEWDQTQATLLSILIAHLPDQELDAASEVADAIQTPLPRVRALGSIVSRRLSRHAALLAKMNAIVRAMPDNADKVSALCEIAKYKHKSLRATILDRALSIAMKLDYWSDLAPALVALATTGLSPSQLACALEFAAETYRVEDHPGTKEAYVSVLFAFGPFMSPDQRTKVIGGVVSQLRTDKSPLVRESDSLLAGILSLYAPPEHRVELFYKLYQYLIRGSTGGDYSLIRERRRGIGVWDWKKQAALQVLSNLPSSLAEISLESVDKIFNDDDRADILYVIVPKLPQTRRPQVLTAEIARDSAIGDTLARTQALASLAKHMPKNEQAGLAETVLNTAQTIERYRFRAIATVAPCLDEARVASLVRKALSAIQDLSESSSRRRALIELAPVLKSEFSDALRIAEELDTADYPALAALVSYLPIGQRHDLIDKCLKAAGGWVATELPEDFVAALKILSEYMNRAQLADAWKIGRTLRDPERADVITVLAPHLDDQQIEEAASTLHNEPNDDWTASAWAALASRLSGNRQSSALSKALEAANDPNVGAPFVRTLPVLLPQLGKDERINVLSNALRRALSIDEDDHRAATLCTLVPSLSSRSRLCAIEEVLKSCTGTRLVTTIGSTRVARGLDRQFLLQQIANLAEVLAEMSGETLIAEIVRAISDTTAWWA
jgi:hypothetical protein